uniref:Putative beclin n=1 Tax=Schistosoma mansoni TaxID=6183 RepID=A0A3Q0KFL0_SCHMA
MSQQTPTFTTGQFVGASSSNDSVLGSTMPYQPVCQRCFNPLQLDQDFEHLQKTELLTLIDATTADSETSDPINLVPVKNSTTPRPRFIVPPNSALSLLNDEEDPLETLQSYAGPTSSLDHRLKVNACLFDVLSGRTEVDHPLCQECADTLLLAKQQCLEFQEEEMKCLQFYLSYLDSTAGKIEAKLKSKQAFKLKSTQKTKGKNPSCEKITESHGQVSENQSTITSSENKIVLDKNVDDDDTTVRDANNELANDSTLIDSVLSLAFDDNNDSDNYFDDDDDDDDDNDDDDDDNDMGDSSDAVKIDKKIKNYTSNRKKYGTNVSELEQTLNALQSNLNELLIENDKLDKQIIQDTVELEKRTEELDRATTQYNDQKLALMEAEEEMQCLESRLSYARSHLHRLQRTNVLNIAFPIWYDGHIGVINGLHLGRLPNRPVGWGEINAAWGQCALLLQCIGKKLNYIFQNHRIVPMGSQSKMVQLSISKEFPLYYTTGGMRLLSAGKFDTAMINFLDCLNQAQQIIEHTSYMQLPFRIKDKGKLQDPDGQIYSIKWNGNSEENWTKALKMMLINMKWIIAALSTKKNKKAINIQSTLSTMDK